MTTSPARTTAVSGLGRGGSIFSGAGIGMTVTSPWEAADPFVTVYVKVTGSVMPCWSVMRSTALRSTDTLKGASSGTSTCWATSTPPSGSESLPRMLTSTSPLAGSRATSRTATGAPVFWSGSLTSTRISPGAEDGPLVATYFR